MHSNMSKKFWFATALILVLVAAGAVIALLMLPSEAGNDSKPGKAAAPEVRAPVFLPLDPFVVNLREDEYGAQFLRLGVVLEGADEQALEPVKQHMPRIRNDILLLLSAKSGKELATVEGKQKLIEEILAAVRAPMTKPAAAKDIKGAYFSEFIIQ